MATALVASLAGLLLLGGVRAEEAPLQIYAAGSLTGAMAALIKGSGMPASAFADPVFGPAGLLGDRLAGGETADIFASADMAQPERIAAGRDDALVVPFARNRMCIASRPASGLDAANLLDKLLDPSLRLATSTPKADPGGDYAEAVFARAESLHPGAQAILDAKALRLLGAPGAMVPVAGHSPAASIFLGNRADALLYYCSSAPPLLKEVEGLVNMPVPDALEVHPVYGLAVRADDADAARFALFILSSKGQAILSAHGFGPIAEAR